MVKNNLSEIFTDLNSESSVILPKSIKIKDINSVDSISNTTSSFMPQKGGSFSATSVNKNNNNEVNQLISMLTSDSNDNNNFTANSTATEELENRLRNMLQDGGAKKKKNKKY